MPVNTSSPIPWVNVQPKPGSGAEGVIAAGNIAGAAAQAVSQPNNPAAQQQFQQVVNQNKDLVSVGSAASASRFSSNNLFRGSSGGGGTPSPAITLYRASDFKASPILQAGLQSRIDFETPTIREQLTRKVNTDLTPFLVLKSNAVSQKLKEYENKQAQLNSEFDAFNKDVENYNSTYKGQKLPFSEYQIAVDKAKALDARQKELESKAGAISKEGIIVQQAVDSYNTQVKNFNQPSSPLVNNLASIYTKPNVVEVGNKPRTFEYIPQGEKVEDFPKLRPATSPGTNVVGYVKEALIDEPAAFGIQTKKEALKLVGGSELKSNVVLLPLLGKNLVVGTGGAIAFAVMNPEKVVGGTVQSFSDNPTKFLTKTGVNLLGFKGVGALLKTGVGGVVSVGKTYVPAPTIVVKEVLSGEKVFPTVKGSGADLLKVYEKEGLNVLGGKKVVYSATNYPFKPFIDRSIVVSAGRGLEKKVDVPGLYTSTKGVSTYFLRLEGVGEKTYSLLPKVGQLLSSPKILAIEETPVRVPSAFRGSLEKAQKFFGKVKGIKEVNPLGLPGKPYVSPAFEVGAKSEAEAVIQVGSKLERTGLTNAWEQLTGFKEFTFMGGEFVPIYRMKSVGVSKVEKVKIGKVGKVGKVELSDYYAGKNVSVVSPSSVGFLSKSFVPSSLSVSNVSASSYSREPGLRVRSVVFSSKGLPVISNLSYKPSKAVASVGSSVSSVSSSSVVKSSGLSVPSVVKNYSSGRVGLKSLSSVSSNVGRYSVQSFGSSKVSKASGVVVPGYLKSVKKLSSKSLLSKSRKSSAGYSVYIRVKGKPRLLAYNLPKKSALSLGASFVERNISRSFVVKRSGLLSGVPDVGFGFNQSRFRRPVPFGKVALEGYEFVERSKFALDTAGELAGLRLGKLVAS